MYRWTIYLAQATFCVNIQIKTEKINRAACAPVCILWVTAYNAAALFLFLYHIYIQNMSQIKLPYAILFSIPTFFECKEARTCILTGKKFQLA